MVRKMVTGLENRGWSSEFRGENEIAGKEGSVFVFLLRVNREKRGNEYIVICERGQQIRK